MIIIGTYFINEKIVLDGLTKEKSSDLQKKTIQQFIARHRITIAKLNPYQLYEYYTIPHALFYDLRKNDVQLECLILYSYQAVEDFIETYPARWLMLKSYFNKIIILEEEQMPVKKIV